MFITVANSHVMTCNWEKKIAIVPVSVPFINKDASSNFPFRKMSVKYLCCPHKVIALQKYRDFLQEKKKNTI